MREGVGGKVRILHVWSCSEDRRFIEIVLLGTTGNV